MTVPSGPMVPGHPWYADALATVRRVLKTTPERIKRERIYEGISNGPFDVPALRAELGDTDPFVEPKP